jgi:hypothetical protein
MKPPRPPDQPAEVLDRGRGPGGLTLIHRAEATLAVGAQLLDFWLERVSFE